MTTQGRTIKASGKGTSIPCRDLAAFLSAAADQDPFATVKIKLGRKGQIRECTVEFPVGGGQRPFGTGAEMISPSDGWSISGREPRAASEFGND